MPFEFVEYLDAAEYSDEELTAKCDELHRRDQFYFIIPANYRKATHCCSIAINKDGIAQRDFYVPHDQVAAFFEVVRERWPTGISSHHPRVRPPSV